MMRLDYISVCGFRGYRRPARVDFGRGFAVIDGRNGVGKSTICDAVEFALTGSISKYMDAKAAGETIYDYIWWRGDKKADDHFVEVGFVRDDDSKYAVIRRRGEQEAIGLDAVIELLCDPVAQPDSPLEQLCRTMIIRDEHIAALSLDMKEADRFQFLRDALGAVSADEEIRRASKLERACKKRYQEAQELIANAQSELTRAAARRDEAVTALADDAAVSEAFSQLEDLLNVKAPLEDMTSLARENIGQRRARIKKLTQFSLNLTRSDELVSKLQRIEPEITSLRGKLSRLEGRIAESTNDRERIEAEQSRETVATEAQLLTDLAALGERLGLHERRCPLCSAKRSEGEFAAALENAKRRANELNATAADLTRRRQQLDEGLLNLRSDLITGHFVIDACEHL